MFQPPRLADTPNSLDALKAVLVDQREWVSLSVELRPQAGENGVEPFYVTRAFTFGAGDTFTGVIRTFADPYGQLPLVEFEFRGHLDWHGEAAIAPGAYQVDYVLDEAFNVTPLNDMFAAQLNQFPVSGLSSWETGTTQDILGKAFPLFGIEAGQVAKDHDLVYLAGGMLFMGSKHVDGTGFDKPENRPTNLQVPLAPASLAIG